jgi:hypothetical protein
VASTDYNRDGRADILWHHSTKGEVWVWLMEGALTLAQTRIGIVPDVGYHPVGVK